MSKAWVVAGITVAGLVGALVAVRSAQASGSAGPPPRTFPVSRATVTVTVAASGNVEPARQASLDFAQPGVLATLDARVGGHVAAGQILAEENRQAAQQNLASTEAALGSAEAKLAQAEAQPASAAGTALDQAESQVTQAQAQVASAESALQATVLRAPFAGVIAGIQASVGEPVGGSGARAGTSLAPGSLAPVPPSVAASGGGFIQLIDAQHLDVVATVAETDVPKLVVGQPASVTYDALPGVTNPARVVAIAPSAVVVSNVVGYEVTFSIANPDRQVRSGMTANVEVLVREAKGVLAVPNIVLGQQHFDRVPQQGREMARERRHHQDLRLLAADRLPGELLAEMEECAERRPQSRFLAYLDADIADRHRIEPEAWAVVRGAAMGEHVEGGARMA